MNNIQIFIQVVIVTNHYISHLKNKKQDIRSVLTSWGCPDNWIKKQKKPMNVSMMLVLLVTIILIEKSYKLLKQNGIKLNVLEIME